MKKILLLTLLACGGCASSGPVSIGQDTFMITKQSSTGFHSAGSVKADIYREATAFCRGQGKQFQPVIESGTDGVPGRSFANAEVQFRCLSAGDYELSRPTAQPVANVRVQSDVRLQDGDAGKPSDDLYTELTKLKALLDSGIITADEFDARKKLILAK